MDFKCLFVDEVAYVALNSGRNVLSILPNQEAQQSVYKRISELEEQEPECIEDQ